MVIGGLSSNQPAQATTVSTEMVTQPPSGNTNSPGINEAFNSKASNLRLQLNILLHEHTALGALTLTALYEGSDTTQLMQLMKGNQDQLASIVQNVYGKQTHDIFVQLWAQHMTEYENYTLAKKNGDTAKMTTAKQNLQIISNKLGVLFAGSGQQISSSVVTSAMMDHVNGTLSLVDAVSQSDASKSATLTQAGYDQAGVLADVLTRTMILQKPNMFK